MHEIEGQRATITREAYVCHDGLPYLAAFDASTDTQAVQFKVGFRHQWFDEMSKVAVRSRQPGDVIDPEFLNELRTRLESAKEIVEFSHKYMAHAADPANRTGVITGVALQKFEQVYRDLIFVTNEISGKVLAGAHHRFLPVFACDELQHIDQPICPAALIDDLQKKWNLRANELRYLEQDANTGKT